MCQICYYEDVVQRSSVLWVVTDKYQDALKGLGRTSVGSYQLQLNF